MLYKESSSLELKVKFTNNILKTISAFSNDNGGKVIVGIEQHLKIEKTKLLRRLNAQIKNGKVIKVGSGSSVTYSLT